MPLITILTPTYNRAKLLPRLYQSLCEQTCKDFEWIVVDDGSTDDTCEVVKSAFLNQNSGFKVQYFKKKNGGKHTAVNLGVNNAKGNLVFIADSDDKLLPNSVEMVVSLWSNIKYNPRIGGIAGLDINAKDGKVIGSGLPCNYIVCNAIDIRYKYHVEGDLKEVFRASVLKKNPFPEIAGEHFCPEQLCWFRIAQSYDLYYANVPFYIADYQKDGLSKRITSLRMNNPIGTCMTYSEMLKYKIPFYGKLKAAINYWRFRACADNMAGKQIPSISSRWCFTKPLGLLMHLKDKSCF